ncbi:hypothetical protein [Trinickia symbiotica]|uniref:hypothetical protein n=1 Tax=Trinickia symbiotica TaxID=863227 RepID=UPI0003AA39AC|nr:hypothetical protein [Trinickia symbiotica]
MLGSLLGPTTGLSAQEKEAQINLVTSFVAGVAGVIGDPVTAANAAGTEGLFNRQLPDQERQWTKEHAKWFAAAYEEKTGQAITLERAEKLLLGTGYMMVDDKAKAGPGYDMAAAQYISENSGELFKATAAERANPGPLKQEQLALHGHEAHPEIGKAVGAGVGLLALGAVAPTAATAWTVGTIYDYAGDVISRWKGWSTDGPSIGKSLVVGGIAGAASPFYLPLKTLGGSTAVKAVVGGYNSTVAGTAAFGAAAVTGSGSPDLSAGLGAGTAAAGSFAQNAVPGPIGKTLRYLFEIVPGPMQAAIEGSKKGWSEEQ